VVPKLETVLALVVREAVTNVGGTPGPPPAGLDCIARKLGWRTSRHRHDKRRGNSCDLSGSLGDRLMIRVLIAEDQASTWWAPPMMGMKR
jgi:hypothetical protein